MAALTAQEIRDRRNALASRATSRNIDDPDLFSGETGRQISENFIPSAQAAVGDFLSLIQDPIGAAKNTYDLGVGLYSLATDGDAPEEEIARALGEYYSDRYGSLSAAKNSLRTDPVGVALDIASVFTGLGGAARSGASLSKKIADAAGAEKTSQFIQKAQNSRLAEVGKKALLVSDFGSGTLAARAAVATPDLLGRAASNTGSVISGASADAIERAAEVGRTTVPFFSNRATTFRDTARGEGILAVSPERFVADSQDALTAMKRQNSAQYEAGKAGIDMGSATPIQGATTNRRNFNNRSTETRSAPPQRNRPFFSSPFRILDGIKRERDAAKGEFSTAEGFEADALDAISNIERDVIEFSKSPLPDKEAAFKLRQKIDSYDFGEGTQGTRIQAELRSDLSRQLKQDPKYRKLVEDFDEANRLAKEIESDLSLGRTKNVSQSLRKLQSVTRNNVNTSFGRRVDLLSQLNPNMDYDPLDVASALSLQSTQPTGGARIGQSGAQTGGILASGQEGVSLPNLALATVAASGVNPRNVGRAAYATGRAAQAVSPVTVPFAGILPQATNVAFAQERADPQLIDEELRERRRRLEELGVIRKR